MLQPSGSVAVVSFYRFAELSSPETHRACLHRMCRNAGLRGTILVSREGVNGTLSGERQEVERVLSQLEAIIGGQALQRQVAEAPVRPFERMKVRVKREIVTMREPLGDPLSGVGAYVEPEQWNDLVGRPDVVLIDVRNAFEIRLGTFEGAIDPGTVSFGEFPGWFRRMRASLFSGGKTQAALFCTGGIRCEKATAFLRAEGVDAVYHLRGGVLAYLDRIPQPQSLWRGDCFVFDERVSVSHRIAGEPSCAGNIA